MTPATLAPPERETRTRPRRDPGLKPAPADLQARITVSRRSPEDIGHRQVFVKLDGQDFAMLRHGWEVTKDVPPGRHRLKVHNTLFWKNVDLELRPGEHARFRVANREGWGTWTLQGILGVGPIYLSVERDEGKLS